MKGVVRSALVLLTVVAALAAFTSTAMAHATYVTNCTGCHSGAGVTVTTTLVSTVGSTANYNVSAPGANAIAVFDGATRLTIINAASGSFSVPVGKTYTVIGVKGPTTSSGVGTKSISPVAALPNNTFRMWGLNQFQTAAAISKKGWASKPTTPSVVVLASGKRWQDALVAAGLAGVSKAPIILTDPASLPASAAAELTRLKPSKVYVVGDIFGVSSAVTTAAATAAGLPNTQTYVRRLSGATFYATSRKVAQEIVKLRGTGGTVIMATDYSPYDALSASPVAARLGAPIILTPSAGLPADSAAVLTTDVKPVKLVITGGTGIIPSAVATQAINAATAGNAAFVYTPATDRWFGQTLYDTSRVIAEKGWAQFGAPASKTLFVATGQTYPDALAGGVLAAGMSGQGTFGTDWQPVLLTTSATLSPSVSTFITAHKASLTQAGIFGGAIVVTPAVDTSLRTLLAP